MSFTVYRETPDYILRGKTCFENVYKGSKMVWPPGSIKAKSFSAFTFEAVAGGYRQLCYLPPVDLGCPLTFEAVTELFDLNAWLDVSPNATYYITSGSYRGFKKNYYTDQTITPSYGYFTLSTSRIVDPNMSDPNRSSRWVIRIECTGVVDADGGDTVNLPGILSINNDQPRIITV